jgi:uncharacterized repeat protein (TIGR02543 family)
MRRLLVPIVTISAFLLAFISTPAQAAAYNGTSGTVACSTSGFFTITDNAVIGNSGCVGNAPIPDEVTTIGTSAFYQSIYLDTVTFGAASKIDSIGNSAFDTSSLTSINIPDSVTTIIESAFRGTQSLQTVTFGAASQLDSIGDGAFSASSLQSIAIPDRVKTISPNAFREAASLATLTFGADSQLVSIGASAFNGATSLTSIRIPDGVASIGGYAFYGTSSLEGFYFFSQAPSVGDSAFGGISAMAYIKNGSAGFAEVGSSWEGLIVAVGVYSLDYDSDDGSAISSSLFLTGDSVLAPTQPTKSGNTFSGWSATDGGSAVTFPYTLSQTADVVLYALWTAIPVPSPPTSAITPEEQVAAPEKEIVSRAVLAKKKYSVKSLAKRFDVLTISKKVKISFKVAKASKKICRVSGTRLITLKAGTCKVTFIFQGPKTDQGTKPKATRTVEVLIVSKKVSLA